MVMEAISIKAGKEDEKAREEAEKAEARKRFKKNTSELDQFR